MYNILRSNPSSKIGFVTVTAASSVITRLEPATNNLVFFINAKNSNGRSRNISLTLVAPVGRNELFFQPTDLRVAHVADANITLVWRPALAGARITVRLLYMLIILKLSIICYAKNYNCTAQRANDSRIVDQTAVMTHLCTLSGLQLGQSYEFSVIAVNSEFTSRSVSIRIDQFPNIG